MESEHNQGNGSAVVTPVTVEAAASMRLTADEQLRLENFYLKAENLKLQQERLKEDFVKSTKMLQDLQKESQEFQKSLDKKYGVDVATYTVQPDGTLVPPGMYGTIGPSGPPVRA